jgi:heat shock protein beta
MDSNTCRFFLNTLFRDVTFYGFLLIGGEDKVKDEEVEKEYQSLCDWLSKSLGEKVAKVQVSKRRTSSPCVLVSAKFGWSANMEK